VTEDLKKLDRQRKGKDATKVQRTTGVRKATTNRALFVFVYAATSKRVEADDEDKSHE
jgi:hypothetical protein